MNIKLLIIAGLIFISGYFLGANTSNAPHQGTHAQTDDIAKLENKLNHANTLNIQLRDKISAITSQDSPSHSTANNTDNPSSDEHVKHASNNNTALSTGSTYTLESAYKALENGNMEEATLQFNDLLAAATDPNQRDNIIEGLIAIHEATYQWIVQDGNHLHGAMWQLFEMQKLRPEEQTVHRAKILSSDILNRANEYLDANNLLSGADHLNALVHTTNMMGYDVEGTPRDEIIAQVKEIEQQPEYKESLYQRASNNLMNGNDLEKNMVFWDFAKLAEIDSDARSSDVTFNTQFADATLVHLQHLKDMNKPGEVKSRQDYIRYAFPYLMQDDRISNFF